MKASNLISPSYFYERRKKILPGFVQLMNKYANTFGLLITANDRLVASLKDIHYGQRAFVIGMGPSLYIRDLDRLKDEITFACNKVFLAFSETNWQPTYYTILDMLVAENNYHVINELNLLKIFPNNIKSYFSGARDIIWLRSLRHPIYFREPVVCFSTNVLKGVYSGWSVIYTMLQLAFYMGIKEVYLIGVDFNYNIPKPTGELCAHGKVLEHNGESNHFHPEYRARSEKWTMPMMDLQYKAFLSARKAFESHGRYIYNASRKTALDVFPLVDFDKIL